MGKFRNGLVALAFALGALSAGHAAAQRAPDGEVSMADVMAPGPLPELSVGKDDAPVTVIEYGSITCSHCADFAKSVLPAFKKKYVETGKVRFVFREFSRNAVDIGGYMLARCRGDAQALATIDLLFEKQETWAFGSGNPARALFGVLEPTGMTKEQFDACLADQARAEPLFKITDTAFEKFKIDGTPSFIINGKVYIGELTLAELDAIVATAAK